jgi:ankyrin repeat protein
MTGDLDLLKKLEASGADLNAQDPRAFDWTPLMAAIYHGETNVIAYLLAKNVDVNLHDREGRTALMWAITVGDTNTVWQLLEKGADPTLPGWPEINAFGYAETSPHRAVFLEWLKQHQPAEGSLPRSQGKSAPPQD